MSDDTVRRLAEQVMRERADCCHDDEGNYPDPGAHALHFHRQFWRYPSKSCAQSDY